MNFKQQIAKHLAGHLTTSQLPKVAMFAIEEGYKSESLYILAGMTEKDNGFEIQEYFNKTIFELNIYKPNKRIASLEYANGIVDDILNNSRDIIAGVSEIKNKAFNSFDFFSESKKYCFDSIGFEKVYGLYDTYDELSNSSSKCDPLKSNELLKKETLIELKAELVKWNEDLVTIINKR